MHTEPYRSVVVYRLGVPHIVLIDDQDWERLREHKWSVSQRGYVKIFIKGAGRKGRGYKGAGHYEYLHRAVLGLVDGDGIVADHISGEKLDNRRSNLRSGTQALNLQNKSGYGRSKYRGVGWDNSRQKWVASVKLPGTRSSKFLGRFATEEEAARVSAAYRAEHMPFAVDR